MTPAPQFNAEDAYAQSDDDSQAPAAPGSEQTQDLQFSSEQIGQMKQLKATGNLEALGQYVAQFL